MLSLLKNRRRSILLSLLIAILASLGGILSVFAQSEAQNKLVVYFFWGDGCPHCAAEKPFLAELAAQNPSIEIREYEVWNDKDNLDKFKAMSKAFGFEPSGVPTTFIGNQYWVGFNDTIQSQITSAVESCLLNGCPDAGDGIIVNVNQEVVIASPTPFTFDPTSAIPDGGILKPTSNVIKIPFLGNVDLNSQSLTISTLLIALVDGVNPCSIWVLSMLMALVIHTGSRKKVLFIGLVFLTVTAAIYAMFIAGLFSVLKVVSFVGWIQVIVALVAFIFAVVNIKDYFWYKEGLSFTISDKNKTGILKKMRNVLSSADNMWSLTGATIVLAAGVSLVEFSCTAGFPVLWTNLLTAHNVTFTSFILLLVLYMVIYQLDEMVIFSTVVFTLKSSKLEEKHGRILKLIGGSLMLTLSIVMLVNPNLMNDLTNSLIIFGIAFGFALLILLVHRLILPKFGIQIGTENDIKKGKRKAYRKTNQ